MAMAAADPAAPSALRQKEAVCGPTHGQAAAKAWNEWLDERDRAPGEVLGDWFREKLQVGVEAARGYALAGLDIAKSRAEVAKAARSLLDSGGEPAREALRAKQTAGRAVATDEAVVAALRYQAQTFKEEAAFQTDPTVRSSCAERAALLIRAIDLLGDELPPVISANPVERDAMALMRLGEAASGFGRPLSGAGEQYFALTAGSSAPFAAKAAGREQRRDPLEPLLLELFRAHDLNGNGSIEEPELVKLNEKIAMLHYGKGADKSAVKEKFTHIFRENLDKDGKPVEFPAFRDYTKKMLQQLDPSLPAQEMILEQFIAEAQSARAAFHCPSFASVTDAEYIVHLAADRPQGLMSIAESPHAEDSPAQASEPPRAAPMSMADRIAADAARASLDPTKVPADRPREPGSYTPADVPRESSAVSVPAARPTTVGLSDRRASSAATVGGSSSSVAAPPSAGAPADPSADDRQKRPGLALPPRAQQHSVSTEDAGARPFRPESRLSDAGATDQARRELERSVTGGFATRDRVQVWSNSKKEWLDGVVLEAFPVKCEAEGYTVPAGTLKVQSAAGVKWIRPGQAEASLRQRPAAGEGR